MRLFRSDYVLVFADRGWRRQGALLRVESPVGVGYADVHPWPEFGEAPLEAQLARLAAGVVTPLTAQSLRCATVDAAARAEGRWLFEGLTVPASHRSLASVSKPALEETRRLGFTAIKLKGLDFSSSEVEMLRESGLRVRLDGNARYSSSDVLKRLGTWGDLGWIDFIEDPCPFDLGDWGRIRAEFGVRLGLDWERGPREYDVRVLKPARQGLEEVDKAVPLVVTSSFDHPIGQVYAAYVAATAASTGYRVELCGLVTHGGFSDPFGFALGPAAPVLSPPPGPGLGFGERLDGLDWRPL